MRARRTGDISSPNMRGRSTWPSRRSSPSGLRSRWWRSTRPAGGRRASGTGKLILQVIDGKLPVLVDTRVSMVDIDDCARGHLLAEEKGTPGQRYVLNGFTLTIRQALDLLERVTGRRATVRFLPGWLAAGAGAYGAAARIMGKHPDSVGRWRAPCSTATPTTAPGQLAIWVWSTPRRSTPSVVSTHGRLPRGCLGRQRGRLRRDGERRRGAHHRRGERILSFRLPIGRRVRHPMRGPRRGLGGRPMGVRPVPAPPGGYISGPTQFTLADTAIWFAVFTVIGISPMAVTTDLSISFLRPATGSGSIGTSRHRPGWADQDLRPGAALDGRQPRPSRFPCDWQLCPPAGTVNPVAV